MPSGLLIVFVLFLLAVIGMLAWLLWRSAKHRDDLGVQIRNLSATAGDIGAIKSQVHTLAAAVQDLGAIRSQVETLSATAAQLGAIKSQVEGLTTAIQDLGAIRSQVDAFSSAAGRIGGIQSQVESVSAAVRDLGAIKSQVETLAATAQTLGLIQSNLESLQQQESQLHQTVRAISNKLIGSRDVGAAGENLLAEAFASFPPGWIERDFRVGAKVVEFALVLPNKKRVPIDSKWPAIDLLRRIGEAADPEERAELAQRIEAAVLEKALEVCKYIDPGRTIHLAIAAIPDSAYGVCRSAHFQAIRSHVLVVSYSMALPVVLALYQFQLEYAASVDQEHLESHLRQIADCLQAIEGDFENRLLRGATMVMNAYQECSARIGRIKASISALRAPAAALAETPAPRAEDPSP